ncbi:hypothetical protein [Dyella sp. C11]|uniref:hypothetical protein n=1 Tax=Dyella sp. C11 TaxID=2126991 RepID=UPI000D65402B|nr:hypothetical protein [Dyella sp. C11]
MHVRKKRRAMGFAVTMMLLLCGMAHAAPAATAAQGASLEFVASPYADFLFYLLHRDNANFPDLRAAVPLDGIKELNTGSFLPAYAMASDVRSYADSTSLPTPTTTAPC